MQMVPVKSSNIKSAGYENGTLRVEFSNGVQYDYKGVTAELYNDFMEAESQGRFCHKNIKSKIKREENDDGFN